MDTPHYLQGFYTSQVVVWDFWTINICHQEFQVPKMEGFLKLIFRLFLGMGKLPYISRIHTAYIGEDSSILGTWNVWWYMDYTLEVKDY